MQSYHTKMDSKYSAFLDFSYELAKTKNRKGLWTTHDIFL